MDKRKFFALSLALAAGLLLGGCGAAASVSSSAPSGAASVPALPPASSQSAPAGSGSRVDLPASSASGGVVPIEGALTPEDVGRPAATTLQMPLEGSTEATPATLYVGSGYSIYLTDGAWRHTAALADSGADVFTCVENDAVTLRVAPDAANPAQSGAALDDAYAALCSEGYLQSDDNDHLFTTKRDGAVLCQYVTAPSGAVWHVSWSYPDTSEYLEGWGARLPVMAQTFAVNPASLGAQKTAQP